MEPVFSENRFDSRNSVVIEFYDFGNMRGSRNKLCRLEEKCGRGLNENENPAEDGFTEDKKQENSADEKLTKAPKTGDTAGLPYAALAALTGSAAAAGIVLKKKIRLG